MAIKATAARVRCVWFASDTRGSRRDHQERMLVAGRGCPLRGPHRRVRVAATAVSRRATLTDVGAPILVFIGVRRS